MREFEVVIAVRVKVNSFAGAEKVAHRIMSDAFNAAGGENPIYFDTLAITKGRKIDA